jgi:hypothetical protein
MRANMERLGYRCVKYGADCTPKMFLRLLPTRAEEFGGVVGGEVVVVRVRGVWVLRIITLGVKYPRSHNTECPGFEGPVTCATWATVSLANGRIKVTS